MKTKHIKYIPETEMMILKKGLKPFPYFQEFACKTRSKQRDMEEAAIEKGYRLVLSDRGQLDLAVWCPGKTLESKLEKFEEYTDSNKTMQPSYAAVIYLATHAESDESDPRKDYIERSKELYIELGKSTEQLYESLCSKKGIHLYKVDNCKFVQEKALKVKKIIETHLANSVSESDIIVITGGSHSGKTSVIRYLKKLLR